MELVLFISRALGRNTAPLAFKSRLTISIGIHATFLALITPRNQSERCHVYFNEKARRDLNARDAVFSNHYAEIRWLAWDMNRHHRRDEQSPAARQHLEGI